MPKGVGWKVARAENHKTKAVPGWSHQLLVHADPELFFFSSEKFHNVLLMTEYKN